MTEAHFAPRCKTQQRPRGYIENYRPQAKTMVLLDAVQTVLQEYRRHWPLTCRQVYYRLVGASGFPKTEGFYKKLCHHVANARRGRLIPFDAIRDDGITTYRFQHFDDEDHFRRHIRELGEKYTRNKLAGQEIHLEVWCEAAGMLPQLAEITEEFSVQVYSSSGFDSLTAKKSLADRICRIGKPAVILHLGDFDPSGESMFEVVAEDVTAFVKVDRPWAPVNVRFVRVALTRKQVEEFGLPTVPPKAEDTRSKSWIGETCQLEALPPDRLAALLYQALDDNLSAAARYQALAEEEADRRRIVRALPKPEDFPLDPPETPTIERTGERVRHRKFGAGWVVSRDGNKVVVDFDDGVQRRIIDEFLTPEDRRS
jgi:hypothetical protein